MAKPKRRKKKKSTGLLRQMARPKQPDGNRIVFADIFAGKTEMTEAGVERVKAVWNDVTTASPADLVTEARGYGYPLQSLVSFYVEKHQAWQEQAESDDFDGLQGNIDYLKSVETWEDFEPIIEGLEGLPPEGMHPCVPLDLASLIIDKRMLAFRDTETIEHAKTMTDKEVIGFLGLESLRKHRGLAIETNATACEMDVESYKVLMDALQARADDDENISKQVNENESLIKSEYFEM